MQNLPSISPWQEGVPLSFPEEICNGQLDEAEKLRVYKKLAAAILLQAISDKKKLDAGRAALDVNECEMHAFATSGWLESLCGFLGIDTERVGKRLQSKNTTQKQ